MNNTFSASVTYNRDNIRLLSETIIKAFHYWQRLVISGVCFLTLGFGLFYFNGTSSIAIIAFSCIILTSIRAPARIRADNNFRAVGEKEITVTYFFKDSTFCVSAQDEETIKNYNEIILIFEDSKYLYIFTDKTSAFMIDKAEVHPNLEDFKLFLQLKTSAKWKYDSILFMLSLKKLFKAK